MGTDINLVVEQRSGGADWQLAGNPRAVDEPMTWFDERRYECFSLLTGLDITSRLLRPVDPVAPLRGWPGDLSMEARTRLWRGAVSSSFGRSWLDVGDLLAYDWDRNVNWIYMTSAPPGVTPTTEVRAAVERHAQRHGRPPKGWVVSGYSPRGFTVTGQISRRRLAGPFIDVIDAMQELAGDDPASVRCVFDFNR